MFSHSSEVQKSKIKVLAELAPSQDLGTIHSLNSSVFYYFQQPMVNLVYRNFTSHVLSISTLPSQLYLLPFSSLTRTLCHCDLGPTVIQDDLILRFLT